MFRRIAASNRYVSQDFLGGPRILKMSWVVNLQKGATLFFVAALMAIYDNYSTAAWVYLGLHGGYGLVWVLKDTAFPDPSWQKKITFGGAFVSWAMVLGPYWVAPFLLISDVLPERPDPSALVMGVAILIHTLGVVIMTVSDAQKYYTLRLKRGLIQDGMFRYIRHPNYLGEMMIYGSYAFLVGHWLPWAIVGYIWVFLFLVNMMMKEASMSRYPEWAAYKARTGMLLPRLFPNKVSGDVADRRGAAQGHREVELVAQDPKHG
jgi:protein-S-isoprenylcysteine O-methyltransferase Ste14